MANELTASDYVTSGPEIYFAPGDPSTTNDGVLCFGGEFPQAIAEPVIKLEQPLPKLHVGRIVHAFWPASAKLRTKGLSLLPELDLFIDQLAPVDETKTLST